MWRSNWILLSIMLLAAVPATVRASVPAFINYSGRLTDGTGWAQSTTMALTLRLYASAEGGSALWEQSFPTPNVPDAPPVAIEDGYFSVMLGNGVNPADGTVLNVSAVFSAHNQTWITVCVGEGCTTEEDMMPRQVVGSVPYAVKADNSHNLAGMSLDQLDQRYVLKNGDTIPGDLEIGGNLAVAGSVSFGSAICVLQTSPCGGSFPHDGGSVRFWAGQTYADVGAHFHAQHSDKNGAGIVFGKGEGCSGAYCKGDFTVHLCCR
jgi:hypothetical protein